MKLFGGTSDELESQIVKDQARDVHDFATFGADFTKNLEDEVQRSRKTIERYRQTSDVLQQHSTALAAGTAASRPAVAVKDDTTTTSDGGDAATSGGSKKKKKQVSQRDLAKGEASSSSSAAAAQDDEPITRAQFATCLAAVSQMRRTFADALNDLTTEMHSVLYTKLENLLQDRVCTAQVKLNSNCF